ncbi:MAG: AMIN domain-containing protein [Candidatus Aminicenantes bacterium]|nr:AMIN domain-containing protein [Candidatus Aminicenantes bacterium]
MKLLFLLRRTGMLGGALLAAVFLAALEGEAARLVSVKHAVRAREIEVFVRVEGSFEHRFYELRDPKRLVIDLTPVEAVTAPPDIRIGTSGVLAVRTGLHKTGTGRVVFDLAEPSPFYLINKKPDGIEVVFLIGRPAGAAEDRKARPTPPAQPEKPSPVPLRAEGEQPPQRRTTFLGLSAVNKSLSDERFQTIFGKQAETVLGFDVAQDILSGGSWVLAAAAEFHRLSLEGESTITAKATRVTVSPMEFGLRVFFRSGAFHPYFQGGLVSCSYEERSPLEDTLGRATGFGLQGGLYWGPASFPALKARAFVKWTRAVAVENGLEVNLGGLEIGAGLALAFSFF